MFRHARQLDLARRLNHADREERILISLRDESGRFVEKSLFPGETSSLLIFFLFHFFRLPIVPLALRNYYYYYYYYLSANFFFFFFFPTPEAKGPNCFFSFPLLSPTITNNETLSSFLPFSPRIKVATRRTQPFRMTR